MKMHLSDGDMAEMLIRPDGESDEQLRQCPSCRSEFEQLRRQLGMLPISRPEEERSEEFWEEQRKAIWTRIAARQSRPIRRKSSLAWSSVAALVALATLLITTTPNPAPPQRMSDPDHELLIAIERMVQSDVPDALQPATLLSEEMSQDFQPNSNWKRR